ncbi:MAG: CcmD family protein [Anaerolineales bacterium]
METTNYMILGYAVIFVVLALYLVSLAVRRRNLQRDLGMLTQLDKKTNRIRAKSKKRRR